MKLFPVWAASATLVVGVAVSAEGFHDGQGDGSYEPGAPDCIEVTTGYNQFTQEKIRLAHNKCNFTVWVFLCYSKGGEDYYRCGTNDDAHQKFYREAFGLGAYRRDAPMGIAEASVFFGACRFKDDEGVLVGADLDGRYRCFYPSRP